MSGSAVSAIVLAGGAGERFGGPKLAEDFLGVPLLERSIALVRQRCAPVVAVVPAGVDVPVDGRAVDRVTVGGDSRTGSLRRGLAELVALDHGEIVVIHDVIRPLATVAQIDAVIEAVRAGADAATATWTPPDVVKRRRVDGSLEHLGREELVVAHGPVAARVDRLIQMYAELGEVPIEETLGIERIGGRVVGVEGDPWSHHVVTRDDLDRAAILARTARDTTT